MPLPLITHLQRRCAVVDRLALAVSACHGTAQASLVPTHVARLRAEVAALSADLAWVAAASLAPVALATETEVAHG